MECPVDDLIDALIRASRAHTDTLGEYRQLALQSELTEAEADRLEAIYSKAEQDPLLNFFINEFDCIWGERIGVLDAPSIETYKDQQAWLKEHLEQIPFDQEHRKEIQQLLQDKGFYCGPIDGVWGDRSIEAIKHFRMEVQRLLQQQGFYDGLIDGDFGNRSVAAVQKFQKNQRLKDDGVAGRKTFSALQSG